MTYKICVTQSDIKQGKRSQPYGCPVGLAIKRATGESVFVGASFIEIGDNWPPTRDKVKRFIIDFDTGKKVKPFCFNIEVEE